MRFPTSTSTFALVSVLLSITNAAVLLESSVSKRAPEPWKLIPEVVQDSYLVVFKQGSDPSTIETHYNAVNSKVKRSGHHHHGFGHKFSVKSFKAYSINADTSTIDSIAAMPEVAYVEKNAKIHVTGLVSQQNSEWNLARISHRNKGFTNYIYDSSACANTTAYVIDSGIYIEHQEFGGRASYGTNIVGGDDTDGNGHGTHVSGIIGGTTFGVCKEIKLISVKIVDANGDGTYADVIAGINWAVADATTKGLNSRSVINLSIAGPFSAAVNAAVTAAVAAGITVSVAAGNENDEASNDSPGSAEAVLTVAATDINDEKGEFSNYGPAVDIWAPGWGIVSAWIGSPDASQSMDGTSMAAPHITGLAAYLIELEGLTSPDQVRTCIITRATKGLITLDAGQADSVNLLAYNGNGA